MDWGSIFITLIVGLLSGGGLVALLKIRPEKRKLEAEAWVLLVTQLQARIAALEEEAEKRKAEREDEQQRIADLETEVEELRDWIKAQGLKPPERKRTKR